MNISDAMKLSNIEEVNATPYDPHKHHRRSLRLPGYDYASTGAYFITITAQVRWSWFGVVQNGEMLVHAAGAEVLTIWRSLPERFPFLTLDTMILMPDHFHTLLWITSEGMAAPAPTRPAGTNTGSLGRCVQAFKSLSTNCYMQGVRTCGWSPFEQRLWQRNYYERVVRADELEATRAYIATNPLRWRAV